MTIDELRVAKVWAARHYRPYSGDDLVGMVMDCQACVDQSRTLRFARHRTRKASHQESGTIVVRCEPALDSLTIEEIAAELERMWCDDLRFSGEAHAISLVDGEVVLTFVTWWTGAGAFVTGSIVVEVGGFESATNNPFHISAEGRST